MAGVGVRVAVGGTGVSVDVGVAVGTLVNVGSGVRVAVGSAVGVGVGCAGVRQALSATAHKPMTTRGRRARERPIDPDMETSRSAECAHCRGKAAACQRGERQESVTLT